MSIYSARTYPSIQSPAASCYRIEHKLDRAIDSGLDLLRESGGSVARVITRRSRTVRVSIVPVPGRPPVFLHWPTQRLPRGTWTIEAIPVGVARALDHGVVSTGLKAYRIARRLLCHPEINKVVFAPTNKPDRGRILVSIPGSSTVLEPEHGASLRGLLRI